MSKERSMPTGRQKPMTATKASSLQRHAEKHPDSPTATTGFVQRAQRAAAKGSDSKGR
jgi:hypothetical protein